MSGDRTHSANAGIHRSVTRQFSSKVPVYAVLAVVGMVAGLVFHEPAIVLVASPFAMALVIGFGFAQVPTVRARTDLDRLRALETESVDVGIVLHCIESIGTVDVTLGIPPGLEPKDRAGAWTTLVRPNQERILEGSLTCAHWGGYRLGDVHLAARDRFGFFVAESTIAADQALRVYPLPLALRSVISARNTHMLVGSEVARTKGEGLEFADIRAFAPGDRTRRINWRLSARRQGIFVNEFHREQNHNVVLLLDTFGDEGSFGGIAIDQTVRAASVLADRFLARRDGVGVIWFGGRLNWLQPESGQRQGYRIAEALIETQIARTYADRMIDVVPARMLPTNALVLVLTPLQDDRMVQAILNLHGRRFDVAVIEIDGNPGSGGEDDPFNLASRIWEMEKEALRYRLRHLGISVAVWRPGMDLEYVIQEVLSFRRYARRPSA